MADAGDLKSPARKGRVGSNPTSATELILALKEKDALLNMNRRQI